MFLRHHGNTTPSRRGLGPLVLKPLVHGKDEADEHGAMVMAGYILDSARSLTLA